jgi:hypothetical protein
MTDLKENTPLLTSPILSVMWLWVKRLLAVAIVLIGLIYFLLQLSSVQNYLVSKLSTYISDRTGSDITAQRISLDPFEGIVLDNILLRSPAKDTILYGGDINVSFRKNIFNLLNNELDLSYIGLKNFRMNITKKQGEEKTNLQAFLDKLISPKKSASSKAPLRLGLKIVDLGNIDVRISDEEKGVAQLFYLRGGRIDINYIDWNCHEVDINSIILDLPRYTQHRYSEDCRPSSDSEVEASSSSQEQAAKPTEPWSVVLRDFGIQNGYLAIKDDTRALQLKTGKSLDYHNFYFKDVDFSVTSFRYVEGESVFAHLKTLTAVDNTGYEVSNIQCDSIEISGNRAVFPNYLIALGQTKVREKLSLSYASFDAFKNITEEVVFNADFDQSQVVLEDLEHFVPSLGKIKFIENNRKELIYLNGRYFGKINNLAGRDVDVKLGNKLSFAGSFNTRDLLDPNNTLINVRLNRFQTSMSKLKSVLNNFNPPENFNKLGNLNFTGRFDGYYQDFVAFGDMSTDLGKAKLDMRLDITEGTEKAKYSGDLSLINFNLGRWTSNNDLGFVNFRSKVRDGQGLTLNTLRTSLQATVQSLDFKKYNYKDFQVNGKIEKNTFNGTFEIHDSNIDFIFDGSYEYLASKSFLDFESKIKNIDLYALHLSKKPMTLRGNMRIKTVGNNVNDFTGNIGVKDFYMQEQDSIYRLNNVSISSKETTLDGKELNVESDLGKIQISGEYVLQDIVKSAKKVLRANYPRITESWGELAYTSAANQRFNFNIAIKDSKNFLGLLGAQKSQFKDLALKGILDSYRNEISFYSKVPYVLIQGNEFDQVDVVLTSNQGQGDLVINFDSAYVAGRSFNPVVLQSKISDDVITFDIDTEKLIDSLENLDVSGKLVRHPKGYKLSLQDNLIEMLGAKWRIKESNSIVVGKSYIDISDLVIADGTRSIEINDVNENKGLTVAISNFDIEPINKPLKFGKMKFGGDANVAIFVDDIYVKDPSIRMEALIPDFTINNGEYGSVTIQGVKAKGQPVELDANIGDFMGVKGTYNIEGKIVDAKIKLREAPMTLIQYLLAEGIKETEGSLDGDFTFTGQIDKPSLNGTAFINNGATKIIYTGVKYYFDKQKIILSNTEINLDGAIITDENGNKGTIRGGLYHQLFKSFGVKASLSGDNIIGLNTTAKENPNYYGFGIGKISADFNGSFDQINMNINAVTGPGTRLSIPVNANQSAIDKSFIKFEKRDSSVKVEEKPFSIKGFDIAMAITLTPDAEVSIIFDEVKNDIIRGRGRGNLKVDITRQGDFDIFGDYEIEQGQYLFTAASFVNKPFEVERGSRIRWTGDPVNTSLDITAKYRSRTAIAPFIDEYLSLASPETQRLADQRSEVDLKLKVGGTLYKPDIKFDLSFPNLPSEISSFTENKLRILRANDLELLSQVVGLLVFKSFIPSNRVGDLFGTSGGISASITTVSEFLSSQLSMAVTNILNSSLTENGLISNVDFEVGVRNNLNGLNAGNTFFPDEVEVRLKNRFSFWDERMSLNLGTNYVLQSQGQQINQVLPDFAVELLMTDDRKMKLRFFGKYDIDPTNLATRRIKYGLGIAYRTEFGSMLDFETKIKQAIKEAVKEN